MLTRVRSNHLQNGLLLTKEFHTLFDRGYVTVTPDYRVRVSPRLRSDWQNGRRYYPYDGQPLLQLLDQSSRPSAAVLAWHNEKRFLRAPIAPNRTAFGRSADLLRRSSPLSSAAPRARGRSGCGFGKRSANVRCLRRRLRRWRLRRGLR